MKLFLVGAALIAWDLYERPTLAVAALVCYGMLSLLSKQGGFTSAIVSFCVVTGVEVTMGPSARALIAYIALSGLATAVLLARWLQSH